MQKVYFFIGTKAQAIKCISLIESLSDIKSLSVKIVNSGQHIQITENIFNRIGNKVEYIYLNSNKDNISDYLVGIRWFLKLFFLIIISKKRKILVRKIFALYMEILRALYWVCYGLKKMVFIQSILRVG